MLAHRNKMELLLISLILVGINNIMVEGYESHSINNIHKIMKYFELFGLDKDFENYVEDNTGDVDSTFIKHMEYALIAKQPRNLSTQCRDSLGKLIAQSLPFLLKNDTDGFLKWFFASNLAQYIDSWAKLPNRLFMGHVKWNGAFSECNTIEGAHYCLADMVVRNFDALQGQFGTCVPNDCSPNDVFIMVQTLELRKYGGLNSILFQYTFTDGIVTFPQNGTFKRNYGSPVLCNNKRTLPSDTIIFIVLCSLLAFFCFIGTITDALQDCFTPDNLIPTHTLYESQENDEQIAIELPKALSNNSIEDLSDIRYGNAAKNVVFTRGNGLTNFLICFSVLKNTKALLNTCVSRGTITSINGIRAISMTWVILGHIYFFGITSVSPDNLLSAFKINERFSYQVVANAYVSVDSFFFLSGLLVSYISLKKMEKSDGKFNFAKFVLHRFIRLTPLYAFAIFVNTSLYPVILNSPEGLRVRATTSNCEKYWWTNLLYINNFYPQSFGKECLGWSWYLANDMQFYIISPLFLFAMYRFNLLGAVISTGAGILISVMTTIGIVAGRDLPALISESWLPGVTLEQRKKVREFGDDVYIKPYTRIAPYLIGLLLGFILSRKIYLTRKPNAVITLVGWTVATGIGIAVIYGPYSVFKPGGELFGTAQNILYASLSRLAWALALAWVVYACQYKMGGIINKILSWSFWVPLSRLTYGAYLFHPIVLNYYYRSSDNTWHFQDDTTIFRFLSVTVVSYTLAFITALLIDLPVYNMERKLLK